MARQHTRTIPGAECFEPVQPLRSGHARSRSQRRHRCRCRETQFHPDAHRVRRVCSAADQVASTKHDGCVTRHDPRIRFATFAAAMTTSTPVPRRKKLLLISGGVLALLLIGLVLIYVNLTK